MMKARLMIAGAAALLSACGGGGDSESTTTTKPSLPSPTVLSASNGRTSDYIGTWASGCGTTLGSTVVRTVRNTYRITNASGATASGTVEQRQYSDTNCMTPWPSASFPPLTATVSIKVLGTSDVGTPTGSMDNFTGSADRVEVTTRPSGSSATTTIQFAAFSGNGTDFRFTDTLPFSALDLVYTKP
ncbi:hypothetical protein HLB44_00760 [Aquincola sp. S2]|uniref:Lipoprotein n=1 Tax=Pseudaquabacterium terrae TaxID=2732868 RepID=A0ABX2ECA2_9BURK|nr:hypothetical protein [Aquabacterium terrae]NRF65503.1 hypothetical protein [Aquabacterium terrae]